MQRPNDEKREAILHAAARFFASRPFHEVRLEDVARKASVGKGTLYVYFDSKETLYLSLVRDGFQQLVNRIRKQLAEGAPRTIDRLERVTNELVDFAFAFPDLYRVMRTRILTPEDPELQAARVELSGLIERVLRDGIKRGEISDPHPSITTQFILSFVRGALLYPPKRLTNKSLKEHLMRVLWNGIGKTGRR